MSNRKPRARWAGMRRATPIAALALSAVSSLAWAQNGANWDAKFATIEPSKLCQYANIAIPMRNCSGAGGAECDYVLGLLNEQANPLPIHLWMSQPPAGWTLYRNSLVQPVRLDAHGSTTLKLFRSGKTAPSRPVFVSVTCPVSKLNDR